MTDEEIAVKLEGHEHEIGSLKHRMKDQEEQTKTMQDLVMSVKELALNMKTMMEEQKDQGERLEKLEQEPARKWKDSTKALFNAFLGAIGAAVAGGLIYLLTMIQ
ncbi:hypothetical protein NIA70_13315 [[Clostridium] scindens]|uniref:hypothetical protein n=1 Tax=Clostridium scindens (strain JCM 10418 / VPI 12708) TaxID=29347 RepID=UPI002097AB22|nr:hypothetical protein [[Clostridium] scindens]MCO7173138.1 hypothetical protein [[Clostridium] scindens]